MSLSRPLFHHVIDNLWLGNVLAIDQDVDVIVNASQTKYEPRRGIIYYFIDVPDSPDADISNYFDDVYDIVCRHANQRVLIHCMGGVSRSVSLMLAVLIRKGIQLKDGLTLLCDKRDPCFGPPRPNSGFIVQLELYEKKWARPLLLNKEF